MGVVSGPCHRRLPGRRQTVRTARRVSARHLGCEANFALFGRKNWRDRLPSYAADRLFGSVREDCLSLPTVKILANHGGCEQQVFTLFKYHRPLALSYCILTPYAFAPSVLYAVS